MATDTADVFSDAPRIVDFDVLEASKENVQRLASGRRATALSDILATPHAQRDSKLAATRNRLRINVEIALEDDEDDPLAAYWRYVNWTLDNYPHGQSAESGLVELIEEATRVLKDHREGHWRGELKYLKLWMLYTSYVEKPTIIFEFLIANEIGTGFALLYEEYAAVLEQEGRRKEADAMYQLGIARRATDVDHLKARHAEFQKRMMSVVAPATPVEPAVNTPGPHRSARTVLGTSSSSSSALAAASGSSRTPLPAAQRPPSAATNAPFQIFEDSTSAASAAPGNAFPDVGTRKTRVKENVPETRKMAGTTIKQAGKKKRLASGGAATSSFVPYVDTEEDAMPAPSLPVKSTIAVSVDSTPKFVPFQDETVTALSTPAPESVMKVKIAADTRDPPTSESEALRRNPLKNHDAC
ncbi:unnamed protein product [Mycena citricolor]|uniref:BUB1 N-terminal domain-containing protein n=1 Tax=Mycena citricolor TaxID=2018698 RepID=A0AAD2GTP7_9AGAR|nr:unnamed protein product [Mycena citricolor]